MRHDSGLCPARTAKVLSKKDTMCCVRREDLTTVELMAEALDGVLTACRLPVLVELGVSVAAAEHGRTRRLWPVPVWWPRRGI